MNKVSKLLDYYQVLENEKKSRETLMKDVAKFVSPTRSVDTSIYDNPDEVHLNAEVYDGKAVDSARKMTDGIFGQTISPASAWCELTVEGSNRIAEKYNKLITDRLYSLWRHGNFYNAAYQFINDGVTLGNAAMLTRARGKRLFYKALNPFHWFFSEDDYGDMDMFVYRYPMTAMNAVSTLTNPSKELAEEAEEAPTKVRWYLYYIISKEMHDRIFGGKSENQFISYIIELNGSEILHKSLYRSNPITMWFYRKNSGEKYGRGPGDDAYQDLMYTNQLSMSILEGAQLRAAPPMIAGTEAKAYGIKYAPKKVMYYTNPERKPEFMSVGGEYLSSMDLLGRRDQIVEYHFMVDFWTMLSRSTTRQTAYEVSEKQGERLSLIAFIVQNYFSSFTGILERSFESGVDEGILPSPGSWAKGVRSEFKFNGFLAQAQRRAVEGQGMLQALNEVYPLLQMDPSAAMIINTDNFIRRRFEVNNVESDVLRTEKELSQIRAAQAESQAKQQTVDNATEVGKASEGAKMDDIMGAMGE